jgi:hypothetical protein
MSYVRVSILGTLGTSEVWSVNPVFDPSGEIEGATNQAALDAAALAIANLTMPSGIITKLSTAAKRTGCRLEVRSDTNDALLALSNQASTSATAGSTAPLMPFQSALVTSLRTDTPGAHGRGRIYWPCIAANLGTDGKVPAADVTQFLTDMKTYLLSIRSALAASFPTIGFDLAVRSKTTHSTPHVTRIQVGNVVDTQRRRRDHLPESYSGVAFP